MKKPLCPQVDSKSAQIVELLNGLSGGLRAYALLRLAQGFLDLSEGVSLQPFPTSQSEQSFDTQAIKHTAII